MSEWISVEDRLPEQAGEYLVYGTDQRFTRVAYLHDWWECGATQKEVHPTHWMPLPDPPEN